MKVRLVVSLLVTLMACQNASLKTDRETAISYFTVIVNEQKLEMLDQIFAPNYVVHNLVDGKDELKTIEIQKSFLKGLLQGIPDLRYSIGDIAEEDDKVWLRMIANGTHTGECLGFPATGNTLDGLSELFIFRFENGKVVEQWVQLDLYNLLRVLNTKKQ
jgi:predicted ester cyclase